MKLLFLHLSDLHYCNKDSFSNQKINAMKKSITVLCRREKINEAIIVFSGDISNSGQEVQFEGVKKIVGQMIGNFKMIFGREYFVNVLMVPGNHDINFGDEYYSRNYIRNKLQNCKDDITNDYLKKMNNFFNYSLLNKTFVNDKIVDTKTIKFGDFKVKANLINTAIFSVYDRTENADYDNGLHHLSEDNINFMKNKKRGDLNIVIMHHSPSFFDDDSKKRLSSFLKEDNEILFYGHEHINSDETSLVNGKTAKLILGGPLSKDGNSIFNCIVYNTENRMINDYKYIWDDKQKLYEEEFSDNAGKIDVFPEGIKSKFVKELQQDNLFNLDNFNDIYVFPDLSYSDYENKDKIECFSTLKKVINDNFFCIIEGDNNAGKTTLAKYIFLQLMNDFIPVLFTSNNIKNVRLSKVIRNIYEEEYDKSKFSFSRFEQEDKNKKIAIIDDADKITDTQFDSLINELKKYFGKIIIIKCINSQYDLLSIAKRYALEDESNIRLRIDNIHYSKRLELLKKVCKYFNPNIDDRKIEINMNIINKMIMNQINFFQLTPSFIVLFAKSVLNNHFEHGSGKVFNAVFHSNITNLIRNDSSLDVSITMLLLQRIAYYIHTKREYPLSQRAFIDIINNYNEECSMYRKTVNPLEFLNKLINIKLLFYSDSNGNVKFCYNSYLAFFVAKESLKQMDSSVIMDIINHIHFGINGDILLFMCYLDENKQGNILDYIIKESKKFFDNQIELDLNNINVTYLQKKQNEISIQIPDNEDKQKNKQINNRNEIKKIENDRLTVSDIYDYDKEIDKLQKYIMTGMKYIEIISKVLPDFIHLLDHKECEAIINAIYTYPNKYLFEVLNNVNEKINELENEDNLTESYTIENYKIQSFISYLQRLSMFVILSVYKTVAGYVASDNTKKALGQFDFHENLSYLFINLLIRDQLGETKVLGEKLSEIYDKSKVTMIKNMCKIIFHNHCLNNPINYVGENQKYVDKFLNVNKDNIIKIRLNNKK